MSRYALFYGWYIPMFLRRRWSQQVPPKRSNLCTKPHAIPSQTTAISSRVLARALSAYKPTVLPARQNAEGLTPRNVALHVAAGNLCLRTADLGVVGLITVHWPELHICILLIRDILGGLMCHRHSFKHCKWAVCSCVTVATYLQLLFRRELK
jgi:hypothetical protein